MPCYNPLNAWQSKHKKPNGKTYLSFAPAKNKKNWNQIKVPCSQCIGCRLERSRQWAVRCVHEAKLHEENCFITLTFNDEYLDKQKSLRKSDFQKFMKRLRRAFPHKKIRYFHCGEYGEKNNRPHHHACIFGLKFPDQKLWKVKNEEKYYTSETLENLWSDPKTKEKYGFCVIGEVTFQSAAYVARYITKKITGEHASTHYNDIDYQTGEIITERIPEYTTMSRRPGIGRDWYEKYGQNWYDHDKLVCNGKEMKPPKYYDRCFEQENPLELEAIKEKRKEKALLQKDNITLDRLAVRERNKKRATKRLKRSYESQI